MSESQRKTDIERATSKLDQRDVAPAGQANAPKAPGLSYKANDKLGPNDMAIIRKRIYAQLEAQAGEAFANARPQERDGSGPKKVTFSLRADHALYLVADFEAIGKTRQALEDRLEQVEFYAEERGRRHAEKEFCLLPWWRRLLKKW